MRSIFRAAHFRAGLAATVAALLPSAALAAGPVNDCPNRDAQLSVDAPLIDVLLNPQAVDLLKRDHALSFEKAPPLFAGTKPPTFAAILTLRQAGAMFGLDAAKVSAADAALRALPVTDADRVARCARYDNDVPDVKLPRGKPRLLLFGKINGFKDVPSVNAAEAAIVDMAKRKGWAIYATDKGGTFNPQTLAQFDAVIWNNISGDVLTLAQRKAFRGFIENGGGYVGVHGSAGDPNYFWDWYADTLIGARFAGHPMEPQFQDARIVVEGKDHPAAARLPAEWTMNDEWYSFRTSPRDSGARVIATLDESTYKQKGRFGENLTMGDHPIAWTKVIGKGRSFYSAIGHRPETYSDPVHVKLLEDGIAWAASRKCDCK